MRFFVRNLFSGNTNSCLTYIMFMLKDCSRKFSIFFIFCCLILEVNAQSVGGNTSGSTAYCTSSNSGFISLTGYVSTVLFWQYSVDSVTWINNANPTPTQSYLNLTQTTHYRAVVQDGVFPPDTSTVSSVTIYPPSVGGILTGGGTFCAGSGVGTLTLSGHSVRVLNWLSSVDGGTSWNTIANTNVTLNYPNLTQSTLYSAVVENIPVCKLDTSSVVSFIIDPATAAGNLSAGGIVCYESNSGVLNLTGDTGIVVDWLSSVDSGATWNSAGITSTSLSYSNIIQTIWYKVITQSGICSADTTTLVDLTVVIPNGVDAGNDTNIVQYESVTLNGVGIGTPLWSPSIDLSDPNIFNPTATPFATTEYILTLIDSNSCTSSDTIIINVKVPIPNAITPNGDGANDFFVVDSIETYSGNSFDVYNRLGNIVFQKSPYMNTWDGKSLNGKELPDGIYYYTLDFGDGTKPRTGFVLVKR